MQLQQVAQAALAPLGGEVLAPGECGAAEHGLGLGHDHAWAIRVQLSVLGQICSAHTQGPGVTQGSLVLGLPGKPCPHGALHVWRLLIPTLLPSEPLHRLGLLPGLPSPVPLSGKHLHIFQCLVHDTSSWKPSRKPRNDLLND